MKVTAQHCCSQEGLDQKMGQLLILSELSNSNLQLALSRTVLLAWFWQRPFFWVSYAVAQK